MSTSAAANIPLICTVCNRQADYSDLSHLLTHIASKAHLANYFRFKTQSNNDAESQRIVEEYDDWYEEWGFQDMMSDRLAQKDKKIKKEPNGTATVQRAMTPGPAMASVRGSPAPASGPRRLTRLRDSTSQHVDPALQPNTRQTRRPKSRPDTPLNHLSQDADYPRGFDNTLPPVQSFNFSRSQSPIKQESVSSEHSDGSYGAAPRMTTRRQGTQGQPRSGSNASVFEDNLVEELVNDNTKLKGIVWNGMDMFDSATPEQKRKRNQKKDDSVLVLLQQTSEDTFPIEMVFRDGRLEVERTITGNPESDDSLISGESEPEPDVTEKKPIRRKARVPLADKDTNNGRLQRNKTKRPAAPRRRQNPPIKVQHSDMDEEEEEALTYRSKRSRTGLSIHRDDSGPNIIFQEQPAPMSFLTSGFDTRAQSNPPRRSTAAPPDFGHSNPMNVDTYTPRAHFRQQTNSWGHLNVQYRPMGLGGQNVSSSAANNYEQWSGHTVVVPQTRSSLPQQYFGQGQSTSNIENPLFQPPPSNNDFWDHNMFGFPDPDMGMADMSFSGAGEINNPLFLGDKSDDEETISAAGSEK